MSSLLEVNFGPRAMPLPVTGLTPETKLSLIARTEGKHIDSTLVSTPASPQRASAEIGYKDAVERH